MMVKWEKQLMDTTAEVHTKNYAYCDMQGNIFMTALDLGHRLEDFSEVFMNSQLAGVIDHSFSVVNGMEYDNLSTLLQIPLLMKSPEKIVAVTMWLNQVASKMKEKDSAGMAVAIACIEAGTEGGGADEPVDSHMEEEPPAPTIASSVEDLAQEYEYAYWLGYLKCGH